MFILYAFLARRTFWPLVFKQVHEKETRIMNIVNSHLMFREEDEGADL